MGLENMIAEYEKSIQSINGKIEILKEQRKETCGTKRYELSKRIRSLEESAREMEMAVEEMKENTERTDRQRYVSHKVRNRVYDRKQW